LYTKGHLKRRKSCIRAWDEENFNGVHPSSAASSCYSMMMKSSTFFLSIPEPPWSFLSFTPRCAHNTRFGLIASISHRELFTKFHVLRNHVKKKPTLNSSSVTTSTIEVHCPTHGCVYAQHDFINVNKPYPPYYWITSGFYLPSLLHHKLIFPLSNILRINIILPNSYLTVFVCNCVITTGNNYFISNLLNK